MTSSYEQGRPVNSNIQISKDLQEPNPSAIIELFELELILFVNHNILVYSFFKLLVVMD